MVVFFWALLLSVGLHSVIMQAAHVPGSEGGSPECDRPVPLSAPAVSWCACPFAVSLCAFQNVCIWFWYSVNIVRKSVEAFLIHSFVLMLLILVITFLISAQEAYTYFFSLYNTFYSLSQHLSAFYACGILLNPHNGNTWSKPLEVID